MANIVRQADNLQSAKSLYEQDEHAWIERQIALMREGSLNELDKEHLIQYLTEMTIRDRRELRSRATVLLQHLLKIRLQPSRISQSWINTILEQQRELKTLLESVPSIRGYVPQLFDAAYQDAVRHVTKETGISADRLPVQPPWTLEQALEYDPPALRSAQPRTRSSPRRDQIRRPGRS